MKKLPQILFVEPDTILGRQYEQFFANKQFRVVVVRDAQSAILAADKDAPDIVVLEVLLARHSGIEFLYEFRSYSEWQDIPVILLSRVPTSELQISQKTINDLAIHSVLYKPDTKLTKLANIIEAALQPSTYVS